MMQIHYGHASLNPVSRIPSLCVLPKQPLNVQRCTRQLTELLAATASAATSTASAATPMCASPRCAVILYDQWYHHAMGQLKEVMQAAWQVCKSPNCSHVYGLVPWRGFSTTPEVKIQNHKDCMLCLTACAVRHMLSYKLWVKHTAYSIYTNKFTA